MPNTITTITHNDSLPSALSIRQPPTRCQQLKHMIGNTPLLAIRFSFRGTERVIYAKAEQLNMTGSIKDRMAFHILKKAYQEGRIQPGRHNCRSDQRQYGHFIRRHWPGVGPSGASSSCLIG